MNRKKQCIYIYTWAQLIQKYTIEWEHISLQSDSSFAILVWNGLNGESSAPIHFFVTRKSL